MVALSIKKTYLLLTITLLWGTICLAQLSPIKSIQKQLPLIKDSLQYVDALNRLGMLMYENDPNESFRYTSVAREIADRLQYPKGKADAANNLGVVFDMKGNLQLALRYYNDAYIRYKEIKDSSNTVQTIMNIASVYKEIGKDQKAVLNFRKALEEGRKLRHDSIMSLVYYNYVLMYPNTIHRDSVPVYIKRSRSIATKYKDIRVLMALEQLSADYYIRNNQHEKGVAMMQQAVADALKNDFYYMSLDMIVYLGEYYAPIDSAKAVSYFKQGLHITEQKGYKVYNQLITQKLNDFYSLKKDTAKAFYYSRKLLNIYDEQARIDNETGIDYIEYALKDQQLESIRLQSAYQSRFLMLAVLICIMTLIIILVLWRNWKQSRKTAEALSIQSQQTKITMSALDVMNKNYARLIKVVAHDLRNPIGAISAITAIIDPDDELPAETRELINLVHVSSKNSLELINELMKTDFDHQQEINKEEINPDELLEQCVHLLSFRAQEKQQHLVLNTALHVKIQADNEKLWRVINNLIVNAIKFSPEGSEIHIDSRRTQNGILIEVKDTGMGIPDNMQDKIFDPFTAAKREGTHGEQAFGLGLYISKQIIEAHNGKIWFKSEAGKGTSFYLELPV
jgi:signal transduction histidine kinase